MENQIRSNIKRGTHVKIVLKKDQPTGILTEGIVQDILTNSHEHHRGIKVRLTDGQVGRVQQIVHDENNEKNKTIVSVKAAIYSDIQNILELNNKSEEKKDEEYFKNYIDDNSLYIAKIQDEIISYICIKKDENNFVIDNVYVKEKYKKLNIEEAVLKKLSK